MVPEHLPRRASSERLPGQAPGPGCLLLGLHASVELGFGYCWEAVLPPKGRFSGLGKRGCRSTSNIQGLPTPRTTSCHPNHIHWNKNRSRLNKHSLPSTGVNGKVFFALVPPGFLSSPICSHPPVSLGGVCCFRCPDTLEAESHSHKSRCKAPSREAAHCRCHKLREASKHWGRAGADVRGR